MAADARGQSNFGKYQGVLRLGEMKSLSGSEERRPAFQSRSYGPLVWAPKSPSKTGGSSLDPFK